MLRAVDLDAFRLSLKLQQVLRRSERLMYRT